MLGELTDCINCIGCPIRQGLGTRVARVAFRLRVIHDLSESTLDGPAYALGLSAYVVVVS